MRKYNIDGFRFYSYGRDIIKNRRKSDHQVLKTLKVMSGWYNEDGITLKV